MVCLSKPYHFKFFKSCLPQILLGPFLNTLTHIKLIMNCHHAHDVTLFRLFLVILSLWSKYHDNSISRFRVIIGFAHEPFHLKSGYQNNKKILSDLISIYADWIKQFTSSFDLRNNCL